MSQRSPTRDFPAQVAMMGLAVSSVAKFQRNNEKLAYSALEDPPPPPYFSSIYSTPLYLSSPDCPPAYSPFPAHQSMLVGSAFSPWAEASLRASKERSGSCLKISTTRRRSGESNPPVGASRFGTRPVVNYSMSNLCPETWLRTQKDSTTGHCSL